MLIAIIRALNLFGDVESYVNQYDILDKRLRFILLDNLLYAKKSSEQGVYWSILVGFIIGWLVFGNW